MKLQSRLIALALAVLTVFTFAGCHQKDEVVLTVGDTAIPSGLYLAFQLEGFTELMNGVKEELDASSAASQITAYSDYFNYTYEDQTAEAYIAAKAEAMAVEYALVDSKFAEYGLELTKDDSDYVKSYAKYYWENSTKPYYEANGVSYETYEKVIAFQIKRSMLFDYYYNKPDEETGKGGLYQVADKDLYAKLGEDYILADSLTVSLNPSGSEDATEYTDAQIKEMKTKLDGYAKRINNGEDFAVIYKEHTGSEPTANATASEDGLKTIYSASASVLSAEDSDPTMYNLLSEQKKAKDFQYATAYVLGGKENGAYYLAVVYDISKDEYYLEKYRGTLLYDMKNDEFTETLAEEGKALTVTKNDSLLKYYKPTNIDYDSVSVG